MDKHAAQSWFSALSQSEKAMVLLRVMFELTLVVRGVFVYHQDSETRWRLAYSISELDHRLTSAALAIMQNRETYPDDVIVDMLFERPEHSELESYFPYVFEQAARYFAGKQGS